LIGVVAHLLNNGVFIAANKFTAIVSRADAISFLSPTADVAPLTPVRKYIFIYILS